MIKEKEKKRNKIRQEYIRSVIKIQKEICSNHSIGGMPLPYDCFEEDIENLNGIHDEWESKLDNLQLKLIEKYKIFDIEHEDTCIKVIL